MKTFKCYIIAERSTFSDEDFFTLDIPLDFCVIPCVGDFVSLTNYVNKGVKEVNEFIDKFKTSKFTVAHREIFPQIDKNEDTSIHLFVTPYYGVSVFQ
ncbi:hypothetical protein [uncultured Parabacteroides sp.]|uniref:hypothetical protein n=1 Tax=uncultured Parabacteroides sp. TaxID=512312 RepID=UPI002659BE6F|nr:hypothetical protein [uncultured Parabacteroides sp.]